MGSFSIWHWLIVLMVVVLVFGTKKLRNIGEDLGSAVKGFREGMKEGGAGSSAAASNDPVVPRVTQEVHEHASVSTEQKVVDASSDRNSSRGG